MSWSSRRAVSLHGPSSYTKRAQSARYSDRCLIQVSPFAHRRLPPQHSATMDILPRRGRVTGTSASPHGKGASVIGQPPSKPSPRRLTAPLLFNSAHSPRLSERFLKMTRLDHLSIASPKTPMSTSCSPAPRIGTPLLRAHFPRAYLDVTREPWELDPQMFLERCQSAATPRARASPPARHAGQGGAENKPIYRERLTLADARMRIGGIYHPTTPPAKL